MMLQSNLFSVFVCFLLSTVKSSYYDDVLMHDLYKKLSDNFDLDALNYPELPMSEYPKNYYPSNEQEADDEISLDEGDIDLPKIPSEKLSSMNENDMNFIDPSIRGDLEYIGHGPSKWGFQYISGGAGEGEQELTPEGNQPNVQEVKSDESLPFYCYPPNPCPKGHTAEADGCDEGVVDTAEAQKKYIHNLMKTGQCTCDREHMFQCPSDEGNNQMDDINSDNDLDDLSYLLSSKFPYNTDENKQYIMAKKSPESDSYENLVDPAKISSGIQNKYGVTLKRVAKKGVL